MTGEEWKADGACAGLDPSLFYPERGEDTAPAKAVCAGCPVAAQCLEYALANGETVGIWGGKSERERRRIRSARPGARVSVIIDCAMCGTRFRAGSNGAKYCGAVCRKAGLAASHARYDRRRRLSA